MDVKMMVEKYQTTVRCFFSFQIENMVIKARNINKTYHYEHGCHKKIRKNKVCNGNEM